jgi:hypothetical protein
MLAPLSEVVGKCSETKVTKAKVTKKIPWHWDEVHKQAFYMEVGTIAKDVVLVYPNFYKLFEVYMDTVSTQLGLNSVK